MIKKPIKIIVFSASIFISAISNSAAPSELLVIDKTQATKLLDSFTIERDVPEIEAISLRLTDATDRDFAIAISLAIASPNALSELAIANFLAHKDLSLLRRAKAYELLTNMRFEDERYAEAALAAKIWREVALMADQPAAVVKAQELLEMSLVLETLPKMTVNSCKKSPVPLLKRTQRFIEVSADVNGKSFPAMIDTGAPFVGVFASQVDALSVRLIDNNSRKGEALRPLQFGIIDNFSVLGCKISNVPVLVIADPPLPKGNEPPALDHVFIGKPLLKALSPIKIVPGQSVYAQAPVAIDTPPNLFFVTNYPLVRATLKGRSTSLLLDTGSSSSVITGHPAIEYLNLAGNELVLNTGIQSITGNRDDKRVCARDAMLTFAKTTLSLDCLLTYQIDSYNDLSRFQGLLGLDILANFKSYTIDLKNRHLVVESMHDNK